MEAHLDFPDGTRACKICVDLMVSALRNKAGPYTHRVRCILTPEERERVFGWANKVAAHENHPVEVVILKAIIVAAERYDKDMSSIVSQVERTGSGELLVSKQVSD